MKNGKVLAKLANDKRVAKLNLTSDNEQVSIVLAPGYYVPNARGARAFATAKAAHAFIRSAQKVPVAREGYEIVTNLMTCKLVEQASGTPWACSVASESYWCS
jgi:hypothetical protein